MTQLILSKFEASAPTLVQTATVLRWRARNFRRSLRQRFGTDVWPDFASGGAELRREGILRSSLQQILGGGLLPGIVPVAQGLFETARKERNEEDHSEQDNRSKAFRVLLLGNEIELDNPFLSLALHPRILEIASFYMRMHVYLRALELWWDRPTPNAPTDTQLWHRDSDDVMNLKVFVYFNDVDVDGGPFCFIPRSQVLGDRSLLVANTPAEGRVTDENMASMVSRKDWRICVGGIGSVIFCDTTGYHKGLKPTKNHRLMLTIQYTSGVPRYPRPFIINGDPSGRNYSPAQLDALNLDVA
jgi:hypothetical protein